MDFNIKDENSFGDIQQQSDATECEIESDCENELECDVSVGEDDSSSDENE